VKTQKDRVRPKRRRSSVPSPQTSALQSILLQDVNRIVRRIDGLEQELERLEECGIDAVVDPAGGAAFLLRGAQDALVKSESLFRHLVNWAPVVVLRLAPDGVILFANGPAEKYAATGGNLVARRWHDVFAADTAAEDWTWLVHHAGKDRDVAFSGPNGDARVIAWRMFRFPDDQTEITEIFGYGVEITERVRSEGELRRSEEHLKRAQRLAGLGSVELDLATLHARRSDEADRILGVDRSASGLFDDFLSNVLAEDRDRVLANLHQARAGMTGDIEYRIRRPDGTIRHIHRENEIVFDRHGRPVTMIGTLLDITELRDSEERLRQSQEHLAQAQRVAEIGSFEIDLRTMNRSWSDECCRIYGVEHGSPLPRERVLELVLPEDRHLMPDVLAEAKAGRPTPRHEFRIARHDGTIRTLVMESEMLRDPDGTPATLLGIVRDVTDIRNREKRQAELEAQLRHAQRLDAIGTLASGIAHDLNNTLVPVVALVPMMMRRTTPGGRDHRDLEILAIAGDRARRLVQQILQFSRAEEPERKAVNLADHVREVLTMMRSTLPATIHIEEKIDEVLEVHGDPGQLYQVFLNLITNAAHAIGRSSGRIVVDVAQDRVTGDDGLAAPMIRVSVTDDGCGMPEEVRDRIFEPFFTTKPVIEGSGLGLSVVHGIVANHGGRIAVESRVGVGTRFDVYLPRAIPPAGPAGTPQEEPS
jgi:PAS domain S-box-containing protein